MLIIPIMKEGEFFKIISLKFLSFYMHKLQGNEKHE